MFVTLCPEILRIVLKPHLRQKRPSEIGACSQRPPSDTLSDTPSDTEISCPRYEVRFNAFIYNRRIE